MYEDPEQQPTRQFAKKMTCVHTTTISHFNLMRFIQKLEGSGRQKEARLHVSFQLGDGRWLTQT